VTPLLPGNSLHNVWLSPCKQSLPAYFYQLRVVKATPFQKGLVGKYVKQQLNSMTFEGPVGSFLCNPARPGGVPAWCGVLGQGLACGAVPWNASQLVPCQFPPMPEPAQVKVTLSLGDTKCATPDPSATVWAPWVTGLAPPGYTVELVTSYCSEDLVGVCCHEAKQQGSRTGIPSEGW
jgi:hypothetical protein